MTVQSGGFCLLQRAGVAGKRLSLPFFLENFVIGVAKLLSEKCMLKPKGKRFLAYDMQGSLPQNTQCSSSPAPNHANLPQIPFTGLVRLTQ